MRALRAWLHRAIGLATASRREREMAEEFEANLRLHVDDNLRAGMTPEEARRRALIMFGNVEVAKDAYRDRAGFPIVQRVSQDLRYAARGLRKAPTFSLAAVITIVLAVGVNTAIFSVLNAAALQPLRTPDSGDLVAVSLQVTGPRGVHGMRGMLSWPEFTTVRDETRALDGATAFNPFNPVTLGGREPRQVLATLTSCEYFDVLHIHPALGRTLARADCEPGAVAVAVVTDAIWRSALDADPAVVGHTISINRSPFVVIGVTPPSFSGTQLVAEDVFVPVQSQSIIARGHDLLGNANMSWLYVFGHLRNGASIRNARADLAVVGGRLSAAEGGRRTYRLDAERATLSGLPEIRQFVLGIGGVIVLAVTLVLLIACANIANLLLARSTARRKEFAVRLALGASRGRLVQQLMTESLLLASIGGVVAFVTAEWGTRAIVRFLLGHLPHGMWPMIFDPRPDSRVLLYVAGLTTLTGVAFGLVPAVRGTRDAALEFKTTTSTDGRGNRRLQQALVTVQVAVCLVLLLSAGLLARALYRAQTIDPGLGMDRISVVSYDLQGAGYSAAAAAAFQQRLVDQFRALAGVRAVALTTAVPLSDQHAQTGFSVDGRDDLRYLEFSQISPSYFDLLGMPIVRGRTFLPSESELQRACIVTDSTARHLWPGEDPLTKSLILDKIPRPVVGVVRDAQISRLGRTDAAYVFLPSGLPAQQQSKSSGSVTTQDFYVLVAGVAAPPSGRVLIDTVRGMDRDLAVDVTSLSDNLEQWRAPSMLVSALSASLALLALVLALTGVFGTVAYAVSRRVREIGIRVALGAAHRDVLALMVRQGMRPVAVGIALGLGGAAFASMLLEKMLYGLSPHDPLAFVAGSTGLFLVALAACYVPARRALDVEPTVALRSE